jgi:protein SCO1
VRIRPAASVIAIGILIISTGCGRSRSGPPAPPAALGTITDTALPPAVADIPLLDARGRPTSLSAWQGKVVVLADFLTLCQEICPLTSANFAELAATVDRAGSGDQIEFVELTVDPARDSSARLAAYQKMFGARPNWALLTGTAPAIATIWKYFGVDFEPAPVSEPRTPDWWTGKKLDYDMDHTDAVIFIDASGRQRFLINGAPNAVADTPPPALTRFLNADGRRNLAHPDPIAWTTTQVLDVLNWLTGKRIGN